MIVWSPRAAATTAIVGLLVFGLAGMLSTLHWGGLLADPSGAPSTARYRAPDGWPSGRAWLYSSSLSG
jgi:hypothetical protein